MRQLTLVTTDSIPVDTNIEVRSHPSGDVIAEADAVVAVSLSSVAVCGHPSEVFAPMALGWADSSLQKVRKTCVRLLIEM